MKKHSITLVTTLSFIIIILSALLIGNIADNFRALIRILEAPGILLSDFISINRGYGGVLNGLVLNMFLTVGLNLLLIKIFKVPLRGSIIAGIFTVAGFTFFGKNVWNALPIYLGVFLYAKFKKVKIKDIMPTILLSSGISPVTSFLIFGCGVAHIPLGIRLPISIIAGIIVGFLIPIISPQALKFHDGFNLYNTGFTMGLLAVVVHGFLRSFGIHVRFVGVPLVDYPDYTWQIMSALTILSVGLVILAFALDKNVLEKYKLILKETGQLASNFSDLAGQPAVILNMGIMGLMTLILIIPLLIILEIPFLAVLGGATLTVMGFAAFGKHPLNALPIIIGTLIGFFVYRAIDSQFMLLNPTDSAYGAYISSLNIHVFVSGIFFATCLSPISKKYGIVAGIITGFVHVTIVMLVRSFQGGFDLYNNGFAAGFVGGILVPIFEAFQKKPKEKINREPLTTIK